MVNQLLIGITNACKILVLKALHIKRFISENPANVKKLMIANINHPLHGLFFGIVSFSEFFGNESYIERNKTLSELYMSNKIGYVT